jgi:hypothetical protein
MPSLGEEVEATNALDLVADILRLVPLDHERDITSLRVHVAADVDNATRLVVKHLLNEVLGAALARRVE